MCIYNFSNGHVRQLSLPRHECPIIDEQELLCSSTMVGASGDMHSKRVLEQDTEKRLRLHHDVPL